MILMESVVDQGMIAKLERFIDRLPKPEKDRAIILIDGKIFSWEKALEELKKGGDLAIKIQKKLEEKIK